MGSWKQKRSRKPISLEDAKLRLTDCIKEMERIILDEDYDSKKIQVKIQAVHAMSGLTTRYARLLELTDFEQRLIELEDVIKTNHDGGDREII